MLKTAWDFFLSFAIRAFLTAVLFAGVCWLMWTYNAWQLHFWTEDQRMNAPLSFFLASVTTLVGLLGTFRRGKDEAGFSEVALASIALGTVAGLAAGHAHVSAGHAGRTRTLRRFPALESSILGAFLIALWLAISLRTKENWILRNGAIIGAAQILWGLTQLRRKAKSAQLFATETQPPDQQTR